jgi:putative OPT family oligopeptide transporter
MTLILSSLVLVSIGLNGTAGMTAALIIGGVVCTALSMAGGFITDLKIGYWLGTTPRKQEGWKFLGTVVSAATVAGVMLVLNDTYGFTGENALVAPQANAMAAVIQPLMTGGSTPWILYFMGAVLALVLTAIGVPALAFSLGMFIPMYLNAPLVVGGLIAWFVSSRSKDEALNKARFDRGTLIASGFIAGDTIYLAVWCLQGDKSVVVPLDRKVEKVTLAYPSQANTVYKIENGKLIVDFACVGSAAFFEIKI